MHGKSWLAGLSLVAGMTVMAADRPAQPLWSGRLAVKTKTVSAETPAQAKAEGTDTAAKQQAEQRTAQMSKTPREPEWLRRMDKNDRATLTGGWKLQNMSGGTQKFTTAGDRAGQYAPNTYQGQQFLQWNNVSTRQDIPSWNDSVPMYPQGMWSQGYVSPNNYFGADAQLWGNMSAGTMTPNDASGGWTMQPWR